MTAHGCGHARRCEECPLAPSGVMRCDGRPCERCRYWVGGECTLPPSYECEWRKRK